MGQYEALIVALVFPVLVVGLLAAILIVLIKRKGKS